MDVTKFKIIINGRKIIKRMTSSGQSLSGKTARGTFWVFTLRIIDRLFKLVRIIILARILSPDDFGIFGIALLVLSILGSFSQTGFSQALIQKKEDIRSYLDTAWTVRVIRAVLIAIVVFFLAKPAASFFGAPGAEYIIRVIGFSIIIQSLGNIAVLYFQKELKFHKFFKYQFIGTVVDFAVVIVAVYLLKSVWALVLGLLAGTFTRCIMSYVIEPYRPKFRFVKSQARELFGFGKWVLGSGILIFFIIQGDDIFVGGLLGATMLGFYQMAYRISNTPTTETTHVISQVSFPLYAKLQEDLPRLRDAYLKVLQLVTLISFPLTGFIIVLAPEFTRVFLGEQWMPIVPAMQVLALAGLLRSIITTTIPLFRATGKPKIETRWQIVRLIAIVIIIYPLTIKYGILGTSIAIVLSAFISSIGFCFQAIKMVKSGTRTFVRLLIMPLVNSIIISLSLYILKFYINGENIGGLILLILIGVALFIGIIYLFDKYLDYKIKSLFKKGITSL